MGAVADSALEAGGGVIGVIPDALVGTEVAHRGVTELHVVSGMHERKRMFTDLSDGFLNIPVGVGTLVELWEAISWVQLGYHAKPVGLLNAACFYNALLAFNRRFFSTVFLLSLSPPILIVDHVIAFLIPPLY